jgi:hypothetical protein
VPDPDASEVDSTPPIVYLSQPPSAAEHALAGAVDRHDGDQVPFWMLAKVAERLHLVAAWANRFDMFFRRGRRWAVAGISAALLNLGLVGHFVLTKAEDVGAAGEREAAQRRDADIYRAATEEKITELRLDIRELRAALRKMSGLDPMTPRGSTYPPDSSIPVPPPDKITLLQPEGFPPCLLVDTVPWLL